MNCKIIKLNCPSQNKGLYVSNPENYNVTELPKRKINKCS